MPQIKSALSLGLRPSAHILRLKKPQSNWSEHDHTLAVAFSRLEAEICPHCQNPVWLCRTTDPRVTFEIDTYRCFAESELQKKRKKWEERNKNSKKDRLKEGEYEFVRPKTTDGGPLPTREDWFARLQNGDD